VHCQRPTCAGAAQAAAKGACGVLSPISDALTHASSGVARARVAAGASSLYAVHLVGSTQVCRLQDNTAAEGFRVWYMLHAAACDEGTFNKGKKHKAVRRGLGTLTCTGSAHAATRGACGAISFLCGANTQASGGVACAGVAAGARFRCAVDLVGSAQVCRLPNEQLQQVCASAFANSSCVLP
jgi:hypothetical protein